MTEKQISLLQKTADFIKKLYPHEPTVGIVLGSGIGNFSKEIDIEFHTGLFSHTGFPGFDGKGA